MLPPRRYGLRLLLVLAGLGCLPALHAANIGISSSQALSFGKFVAASGSITVSPSGTRVASGGIVLLQTGPGQAAQFVVSGNADVTYAVTLPADVFSGRTSRA